LRFLESPDYVRALPRTQYTGRRILEGCCEEPIAPGATDTFADFPLDEMTTDVLEILRDRKGQKFGAADNRVKALRRLFKWASRKRFVSHNPAADLEYVSKDTGGWHTWTPDEIDRYEAHHTVGSMARLALDLIQYSGLSRMDAVKVGASNIKINKDGQRTLSFSRGKTGVAVELAMPKALLDAIRQCPIVGSQTFLVNSYGNPFTVAGFGNKFRAWCDGAGLPQCSAHGLRKAAATRAAENGATTHELMAMFGWLTVKQAEIYTREASRQKLAAQAGVFLQK
jgi:integrase